MAEPGPVAVLTQVDLVAVWGTVVHLHHRYRPIPTAIELGYVPVGRTWRLGQGVRTDLSANSLIGREEARLIFKHTMREVLWEVMCQGGTSLALGQYFDHGGVPLDAQLVTRK